jgi:TatD DNase family protein
VVKAYSEIMALKRELRPMQPWIIHGFRGKPELARQLLCADFYISLGERFNPAAAAVIPADRLLVETDDSTMPIAEIASRLPQYTPATAERLLR